MASSSVSQESLDRDEYEYTARKSRIRNLRSRGPSHKGDSFDGDHNGVDGLGGTVEQTEGSPGLGAGSAGVAAVAAVAAADHDSPTRISRAKDRDKRSRPNHLHKGKTAKDKRKLREKRRSTGVVHLPSTESTGDSLDEEEADKLTGETKRNTSYNEVIDADNPQTPEEERQTRGYNRAVRNKSPSDLEADLEDNQDYDSTVSQSETNLTIIGQSSPQSAVINSRLPSSLRSRTSPDSIRPLHSTNREDFSRPVSYPSRFRDNENDLESANLYAPPGSRSILGSRIREREIGEPTRRLGARDSYNQYHNDRSTGTSGGAQNHTADTIKLQARNAELERLLDAEREETARLLEQIKQERDEKSRLRQMLDSRDLQINHLQRELHLLSTDCNQCLEENDKLQEENYALMRALSKLKM